MQDNKKQKDEQKKLMGEDGHVNRELKDIMKYADAVTYQTQGGKLVVGYLKVMRHLRRTGNTSKAVEEYSKVKNKVDTALNQAIGRVHSRLSDFAEIDLEGKLNKQAESAALEQDSKTLNKFLKLD